MKNRLLLILLLLVAGVCDGQIITTFAGNGTLGSIPIGDNGQATDAQITPPSKGRFDAYGNLYFGSNGNRIRKIDLSGVITTIAGTGASGVVGFSGDNGPATLAQLNGVGGVLFDKDENIYFVDVGNLRIRKITKATGIITTIAGNGTLASTGDGGLATNASLGNPQDLCMDSHGNIYVAEFFSSRIRKISSTGIISHFAGVLMSGGYGGDGGRADTTSIGGIGRLFCDKYDNIYAASNTNSRIFKITASGIITSVAGTGTGYLYNGDEIAATSANIDPYDVIKDEYENLYVCEYHNFRVRLVDATGIIHTIAGTGVNGFSGDGGPPVKATFNFPVGIAIDPCGDLYISDNGNGRIRKITYPKCHYLETENILQAPQQLSIYPTPTNDILHINNLQSPATYKLLNMPGAVLQQGTLKAGDNSISIEALPVGMYMLEVVNAAAGLREVRKVVKQ